MKLDVLKLSIFSLTLRGIDTDLVKMALENAEHYKDSYLEGEAYKMNDCVYYLESSGGDKLHIAAKYNKYPDVEALIKKDPLVASFRPEISNIKFAKIEVLWPQWQKMQGFIMARYLSNKDRKQRCAV